MEIKLFWIHFNLKLLSLGMKIIVIFMIIITIITDMS